MKALFSLLCVGSIPVVTAYQWPKTLLSSINPLIGTTGPEPNLAGGMIPSVSPPFGSTRWVAETQHNHVSATPFNYTESYKNNGSIHGFLGTRQPAIWMGESAWAGVVPGMSFGLSGDIKTDFEERALPKIPDTEQFGVGMYSVGLEIPDSEGGTVQVSMSASSRVGHFQFVFRQGNSSKSYYPYVFLPTARPTELFHTPDVFVPLYPNGTVEISPDNAEICGSNSEMQDFLLTPNSVKDAAQHFTGWYCARFDTAFSETGYGVTQGGSISEGATSGTGEYLGGYARFKFPGQDASDGESSSGVVTINLHIATSLISADQARYNLNAESFVDIADTQAATENAWAEKVERFQVETDGSAEAEERKVVLLTSVFHALHYPYETHEDIPNPSSGSQHHYYSAHDNSIHEGESYSGYSVWDTYRAAWAFTILFAPERVPGMVRSMLQDYKEGGWLPMWKNMIETSVMIGSHADSLLAEALLKGFGGLAESGSSEIQRTFTTEELTTIWESAWKDASVPPVDDDTVSYSDREEGVDYEARAGLSTFYEQYADNGGWVANDIHSESVSRTLDYAYDDHAVAVLSTLIPSDIVRTHTPGLSEIKAKFYKANSPESRLDSNVTTFLNDRALANPWTVWNPAASAPAIVTGGDDIMGFVQARQQDGTWGSTLDGFTEGDRWVYSFDYVHDVAELVKRRGGNESFVKSLNEFFDGGWADFTNEPAHHAPYLYALAGAASYTQERVREIAQSNFNNTPNGLSGNEDCGQMSAWYVFSAMGFYPVNPVAGVFVVGSPFFSSQLFSIPVPPFIPPAHSSIIDNPYYNSTTNSYELRIVAPSAETKQYVKGLSINGKIVEDWEEPVISYDQIRYGGLLEFEMSDQEESWGGGRGAWTRETNIYTDSAFTSQHVFTVEHNEL
ncbi:glycosyl hydrolase family 92-domain-containing protein [Rhodocollybia butyracea]|uniref:Glycosyl hydrolase family 92-domain-containing protein n=1 Tax=Rhodocollybia butyracea TaxID=206335 RepID=A0A9P5U0L5_9AGAR|nr:glycosyl hydrolase family 92-domain-containing protein [Rhodocollybia butyracea]